MSHGTGTVNLASVSSNAGYSGTPLWKLKQQGALQRAAREEDAAEPHQHQSAEDEGSGLRIAADAVSLGRGDATGERALVRHVIVKDVRKVAARSKVNLPTGGLFDKGAPLMFCALFDGQSSAEAPGPLAAEWCAKQVLPKLLRNLSALPPGYENATFVKASLTKTFQDLDKEMLHTQPSITDGCGAAACLIVGERLFSAVCGRCEAVLSEAPIVRGNKQVPAAVSLGSNQGAFHLPEELKYLAQQGLSAFPGEGGQMVVSAPSGAVSSVSRSLGDRAWKGPDGGVPGSSLAILRSAPETRVTELSWAEQHQCLILCSAPVAAAVSPQERIDIAQDFAQKPRAASGEIAEKALAVAQTSAQCTSVVVYFLAKDDKAVQPPPAKKAKKEAESVRLRHIVVKHRDLAQPLDPVRNRHVTRSRDEAETLLRRALKELVQEAKTLKLPMDANKAKLAALQPSPKFTALCKEMSECSTAQKGGGMMGDLGWLQPDQLARFGPVFADTAKQLAVGQWSDLAGSDQGIHILQRIA